MYVLFERRPSSSVGRPARQKIPVSPSSQKNFQLELWNTVPTNLKLWSCSKIRLKMVRRSLNSILEAVARSSTAPIMSPTSTTDNQANNNSNGEDGRAIKKTKQDDSRDDDDSIPGWQQEIANLLPRPPTKDGKAVVTCLDFGVNREERDANYPDAFFCAGCIFFVDDYGIASAGRRKKMFPNGSRYKCTAKHQSFEEPASNKIHSSLRGASEDENGDTDDAASCDF